MTTTHPADDHALIRVEGARENNLKDVSVDLPKRRLTVFTGVSGSGKSSLVFATIAAESQRMINETYSAFVQGFMPSLARPNVDHLEGLTTAIIVDQERMGANPRSTVGTATDANAMLRILFSRLGDPYVGPPTAYSFNVPTRKASGMMTTEKGGRTERRIAKQEVYLGGMCPRCEGMGKVNDIDLTALYDEEKSLSGGALTVPGYSMDGWYGRLFEGMGLPMDKPIKSFTKKQLEIMLWSEPTKLKVEGVNLTFTGMIPQIQKSILSKDPEAMQPHIRRFVDRAVTFQTCPDCEGTRLTPEARKSKINGKSIADLCEMQISDLADWIRDLKEPSVAPLLKGLQHLLDSFSEIGLGYLSLERPAGTLSGGEAQRTKMIRHLGSSLTDVTYVFDEPTIGLHPHDIERMNNLLLQLRDKGNTVLVVEHKPETIAIADHVVDIGPGAGAAGGTICFEGDIEGLRASGTITGKHLDDRAQLKESVRESTGSMEVRGASTHNLKDVDVDVPLGLLTVVTGVAGSGKSSLIHGSLAGRDEVIVIDQGAIKGSRRSNPATYTGLLEPIRKAFAKANDVKPALFSANSEGACSTCNGAGVIFTELGPMATVESPCEECEGRRFKAEVLEYTLGGKDIAEVHEMSVVERPRAVQRRRGEDPGGGEDPRAARRRRPGLPVDRATPDDAVRRRAPAPQARHADGGQGRHLHPRRAHDRPPPRRRREPARPARPARRLRQVRHRHRAPPGRDGPRRLDHRHRSRRRSRRRHGRLRGAAGRHDRGEEADADRQAPGGVRRRLRRLGTHHRRPEGGGATTTDRDAGRPSPGTCEHDDHEPPRPP